jgi:hypothetical protein
MGVQDQAMVRSYVSQIETKFNIKFEPGHNPDLEFMAHLWEPLRTIHKPLAIHLGCEAMCLATDAVLYGIGFQAHRTQVRQSANKRMTRSS